ncbi:MAG: hypothetical protein CVV27_01500 [Candidatus Melainabacteria bacterium HGW-Melainabacteria-1]|nr:MAG: hypothetical protein CVV27_01500 [Candidatus Melainabacteria bacterium HGW-Melainabacteria-1]
MLVLPPQATPGETLHALAQDSANPDELLVFLQPGFMPHRSLLELHQRFHQRAGGPAIGAGSNQFHPDQALSLFALASQQDQLLFNFFPLPLPARLGYPAFMLHNLSLPARCLPQGDPQWQSWRFCGWDLGLRLWQQGLRVSALHEARSSLTQGLDLDTALGQWLDACRQDLGRFLHKHPYPIPGWELDWPDPASQPDPRALQQQLAQLRAQQHSLCVPVERDDANDRALQAWRLQLRRHWRAAALQVLSNDPRRPELAQPLVPPPWRQAPLIEAASSPQFSALARWQCLDLEACRQLAQRYYPAWHEVGPGLLGGNPAPEAQPSLLFLLDGPFDSLLRAFLAWEPQLPPRSLMVLAPLSAAPIRQLHQLIVEQYPWAELDRLAESAFLCRLAP